MTTYRLGSSGQEVRQIQIRLQMSDVWLGSLGGIFASDTGAAVKSFQKSGEPFLGMEKFVRTDAELAALFKNGKAEWVRSPNTSEDVTPTHSTVRPTTAILTTTSRPCSPPWRDSSTRARRQRLLHVQATRVAANTQSEIERKESGMNASSNRSFAVVALLAYMTSLLSVAAELRPYSLPSQQAAPRIEQRPMEQRTVTPRISEAYYQNFEERLKGLKPEQRADLTRVFERNRDQAIESGNIDEAQHYLRLLQIVRDAK